MVRIALWSLWLSSGLIVLLILGATVVTLFEESTNSTSIITQINDSSEEIPSSTLSSIKDKNADDEINNILKQIYNRKGYSNPTPTPGDEVDEQDIVVTHKPRRKRPLRLIGKDFDPNKSYIIKHPNGTLTYVFPNDPSTSTSSTTSTTSTTEIPGEKINTVVDRSDNSYPAAPTDYLTDDDINEIMNSHKANFEGAFGEDLVIPDGDKLNSRFDSSHEPFLCDSEETVVHPRIGTAWDNTTVRIVNTKDYKQGVRQEICRNEGQRCNSISEFETVCKQIYHYRTLVALDPKTKQPYKEQIVLPSCCKCAIVPT